MRCQELVLKIASRCNLNCSYCYMYNLGDMTYLDQPKFMSDEVVTSLLERVYEHCTKHGYEYFGFTFHGGEPLLADKEFFRKFVAKASEILLPDIHILYKVQTNGVLMDKEWVELFDELNINVGFSMDGTEEAHDMYRVDHAGRGSYKSVIKGMDTYKEKHNSLGVITVLNYEVDPVDIYENMKSLDVTGYNILLPDCIYETRPQYLNDFKDGDNTPVGDWLIKLFDVWYNDTDDYKPQVDIFNTFIYLILGLSARGNEIYGENENSVLVIETNGDIETVDTLKACGPGFTKDGSNVFNTSFDEALNTDLARLYHLSHKNLAKQCQVCPLNKVCGGGYIVHRYSKFNGFNNPSLYCKDLMKIITYIQNKIFDKLPQEYLDEANLVKLNYWEVREEISRRIESGNVQHENQFLESFSRQASDNIVNQNISN